MRRYEDSPHKRQRVANLGLLLRAPRRGRRRCERAGQDLACVFQRTLDLRRLGMRFAVYARPHGCDVLEDLHGFASIVEGGAGVYGKRKPSSLKGVVGQWLAAWRRVYGLVADDALTADATAIFRTEDLLLDEERTRAALRDLVSLWSLSDLGKYMSRRGRGMRRFRAAAAPRRRRESETCDRRVSRATDGV